MDFTSRPLLAGAGGLIIGAVIGLGLGSSGRSEAEAEVAAQREVAANVGTLSQSVEGVDARIAALEAERAEVASGVDAALLKQYEQVRKARRGVGLVEIIDKQRCGGCNVRLPIHVIQKARSGTGVTRCPSCGRLLWAREA